MSTRDPIDLVFFHSPCLDGSCAAWAAWRRFPGAEFVPSDPSLPPTVSVSGRHVLLVDLCFDRATLLRMAGEAASIVVLDHHETSAKLLSDLPFCRFDMGRSGARIAWDELHPGEPPPWVVDYVQDGDFWRFALPGSKAVRCYLEAHPRHDWACWDRIAATDLGTAVRDGSAMLALKTAAVTQMAAGAALVEIAGHRVPLATAGIFWSEVAGLLAEQALFGASVRLAPDGAWVYSLRSAGSFDVGALALQRGGGGHKKSAGFSAPAPVHRHLGPWVRG